MKKGMLATACATLLAGSIAWGANPVYSVNMVGYQKLSVPASGTPVMLAVNWNRIGGVDSVAIQDVIDISNLVSGVSFDTADDLYVWDSNSQGYKMYYLWTDRKWYEFMNDNDPTTNRIERGQGLWLVHRGSATTTLVVGEVPTEGTNIVAFGAGLTQFGSAYTADIALNGANVSWTGNNGASFDIADDIYVWDGATAGYNMYYRWTDNQWYKFMDDNSPTTDKIPMGYGAWYLNRGPGSASLTESRPY